MIVTIGAFIPAIRLQQCIRNIMSLKIGFPKVILTYFNPAEEKHLLVLGLGFDNNANDTFLTVSLAVITLTAEL